MSAEKKLQHARETVKKIGLKLVEPVEPVGNSLSRRQIQLLASLLLIIFIASLVRLVISATSGNPLPASLYSLLLGVLSISALLYSLSRTRLYRIVILAFITAIIIFPFAAVMVRDAFDIGSLQATLSWLILGFLLSISFLSLQSSIILILCAFGAILALPLLSHEVTLRGLSPLIGFLATVSAFITANIIYRESVEHDRQKEILAERDFSENIISGLPGIFLLFDQNKKLIRWNKHCEDVTEFSASELHEMRLFDLVNNYERPGIENTIEKAAAGKKAEREINIQTKSGIQVPFYFSILSKQTNGNHYLFAFGTDMTEMKRIDEARRAVVENSLLGLAIYQDEKVVFANPACNQIFGYSMEEIEGMTMPEIEKIIFVEDRSSTIEKIRDAISKDNLSQRFESQIVRKDGSLRWIDFTISLINFRDRIGVQATIADITERKLLEVEQARLIWELEAKNAELERFTYTVSHDLKSPLITIRGFLGFLERDAMANNKARIIADMQRIVEATNKMQNLLNDLLGLSRIGHVTSPTENISFEDIAVEAAERVAGQIRKRGVHVTITEGLPIVRVDRERIVEVVQNLIDNAVKFMGAQPNPAIKIGTRGVNDQGMPILYVMDNGVGVNPEFHERIFGLFNKLDPSTDGTGIGLALVKRIIEVHGGRIWIESEGQGKGTTFLFILPQASE